jgi:hypothetical protein
MALTKSTRTMRNLSVSFFLLFTVSSWACGWYETAETIRLALFRSERMGSEKFRSFYYSADNYFQTYVSSTRDDVLNSKEWQKELGGNVTWEDVYKLQYETDSEKFQTAFNAKKLKEVFKGNTFIEALVLPKNKALLDYFADAKLTEYHSFETGKWENWDKIERGYSYNEEAESEGFPEFKQKLLTAKNEFLKQRYAYLLMRSYSVTPKEMIRLYDTYFADSKNNTIIKPWALFFKAISTENSAEANYYLSQVLASCDDKSFGTMQRFNRNLTENTLSFAKNDDERANIIAMKALRNPAPAFEEINQVYSLSPQSEYLSVLVGREVNKLEDWIFTPKFYDYGPAVQFEDWYKNYEVAKKKNLEKDTKYLKEFRSFLISIFPNLKGEQKDFMASAISQLAFMDDEPQLGKQYASLVSADANASILAQKNIQLALVEIKLGDINSDKTKEIVVKSINGLRDLAEKDQSLFKSLYSLTRLIALEYEKKNDIVSAGLLYAKSQQYKSFSYGEYSEYYTPESPELNYGFIGYFDQNASEKDMDGVISMLQKKNKTDFEEFLCSGTAPIDFYRDVKGTIAFRNQNLELAEKTFGEMNQNFWKEAYQYSSYLNEDPFVPQALEYKLKRNYTYDFDKTKFLKEMVRLSKLKTADGYLKMANAYYNVSYFGNSWMMASYGQTSGDDVYFTEYCSLGRNVKEYKMHFQNGNYYKLSLAKEYYKKVVSSNGTDEQKAMASLMIHICDYENFNFHNDYDSKEIFKPGKEVFDFYSKYNETKFFKKFSCPLLESFVK